MVKGVLLLLIATLHTSPMGSEYLLVQLEDASDERIEAIGAIGATGSQGKHSFRK